MDNRYNNTNLDKQPDVKRLRTKLSTVRSCLNGITNLIHNVPRDAIDVTTLSDTTLQEVRGRSTGRHSSSVQDQRKSSEFVTPAPPTSKRSSAEPYTSNLSDSNQFLEQQRSRSSYPRLPSSIEIEILPSSSSLPLPSDNSGTIGGQNSYGSIGVTPISRLSSITNLTGSHRISTPTLSNTAQMKFMQIHRGSSGKVNVSGAFPHSSRSTPLVSTGTSRQSVQPRTSTSNSASKRNHLQQPTNAVFKRPNSTTSYHSGQESSTRVSSAVEFSVYPSGGLDEDVLNESLRDFMSDEDSHSDEDDSQGDYQEESIHLGPPETSRAPPARRYESFGILSERSSSQNIRPPAPVVSQKKTSLEFHPAANSTLIEGFANLDQEETPFDMDTPTNNGSRSPPSALIESALELADGPKDEQRTVGTQTRGPALGSGGKHLQCQHCRRHFETLQERESHELSVHAPNRHKCTLCQLDFANVHNLKKHRLIRHGNNGEPMTCRHCSEKFQDYVTYMSHLRTHSVRQGEVICPKCNHTFHPSSVARPVVAPTSLTCIPCQFKTHYNSSFVRHTSSQRHFRRLEFIQRKEQKEGAKTARPVQNENQNPDRNDERVLDGQTVGEVGDGAMESLNDTEAEVDAYFDNMEERGIDTTAFGDSILNLTTVESLSEENEGSDDIETQKTLDDTMEMGENFGRIGRDEEGNGNEEMGENSGLE